VRPLLPRLPRVPTRLYRWVALLALLSVLLLIATGGWVRLSESGLGCPTWPTCYAHQLVAKDSYHALVEFVNRCVITIVAVLIGCAVVGAVLAPRRRPDLIWLSVGLFAGYVLEAVLGGITVLFKLAPELVAAHMIAALLLLTDAVVLHWRVARLGGEAPPASKETRLLARLTLLVLTAAIVIGTIVTGSGPHSGSNDASRLPFEFRSVAELHAVVVMFLLGLLVAMWFVLRAGGATPRQLRAYELLLLTAVLQGAIGYTQYFNGLPIDVVELHILGAGILVVAMVRFTLLVHGVPRRVAVAPASPPSVSSVAPPVSSAAPPVSSAAGPAGSGAPAGVPAGGTRHERRRVES